MISEKTVFGIIGCGAVANLHAEAIKKSKGILLGAADARADAAVSFCARHGIVAFENAAELLASPEIDAVCICTPSGTHAAMALAAINAGKHVLVEKPLAMNFADCTAVIRAAKAMGVKAGVVSQLRFAKTTETVKSLVENGGLGRVVTADITMKYHRSPEYYASSPWRGTRDMDGGALMNQGIHGIDLLLHIMGPVKRVFGLARTLAHGIEAEDTAVAVVEFECGALGTVQGTTSVAPGYPRYLEISGTKGTVGITENRFTRWDIPDLPMPQGLVPGEDVKSGAKNPMDIDASGHLVQIADFISAIREDREPLVTLESGRRTVELINAICRSSETGVPEILGE